MVEKITITDFQPYLHHSFAIRFTLEFEIELTHYYYLQGTFTLVHPVIGELLLFMVPIGSGTKGMRYEVVIS
jgi:hypothetical protein